MQRHIVLLAPLAAMFTAVSLPAQRIEDRAELREAARLLEREAKAFNNRFDRELDKSLLDNLPIKERLDLRAEKLKGELDGFHGKVKAANDKKARRKLDRAMQFAHDIDRTMRERRFSEDLERQWEFLRIELNRMADYYDLRPLGA